MSTNIAMWLNGSVDSTHDLEAPNLVFFFLPKVNFPYFSSIPKIQLFSHDNLNLEKMPNEALLLKINEKRKKPRLSTIFLPLLKVFMILDLAILPLNFCGETIIVA